MPGWITRTLREGDLTLGDGPGYSMQKTENLLEQFDQHASEAHAAIADTSDDDFQKPWSLKMGDQVVMTMSRYMSVRSTINHLSHHRGQLTVYLRELDVPIPSIYGPTADEPWGTK